MAYPLVRIIFGLIFLTAGLWILRKKGLANKLVPLMLVFLITLGLETALLMIPVENLFFSFSSPESAFAYQSTGRMIDTVDAEKSTLVIFEDGRISFTVLERSQKGWKLCSVISNPQFMWADGGGRGVWVYGCAGESYVIVYNRLFEPMEVFDSIGSVFEKTVVPAHGDVYVAPVGDMGQDYSLTVDGRLFSFSPTG